MEIHVVYLQGGIICRWSVCKVSNVNCSADDTPTLMIQIFMMLRASGEWIGES